MGETSFVWKDSVSKFFTPPRKRVRIAVEGNDQSSGPLLESELDPFDFSLGGIGDGLVGGGESDGIKENSSKIDSEGFDAFFRDALTPGYADAPELDSDAFFNVDLTLPQLAYLPDGEDIALDEGSDMTVSSRATSSYRTEMDSQASTSSTVTKFGSDAFDLGCGFRGR